MVGFDVGAGVGDTFLMTGTWATMEDNFVCCWMMVVNSVPLDAVTRDSCNVENSCPGAEIV